MSNNDQEHHQNESQISINARTAFLPSRSAYAHSQMEVLVHLLCSELCISDSTCTVQEMSGDVFVIMFKNTTIRAVSIAQHLRIYAELPDNKGSIGLTLNVSTIFKPYFSHRLSLDHAHITAALRLPRTRITDIIHNRIVIPILLSENNINQQDNNNNNNFNSTLMYKFLSLQALMLEITLFLKKRDICRLLTSSQYLRKLFWQSNEFFFALYTKQFGKTGFKLQQLQWREVYLKKLKK